MSLNPSGSFAKSIIALRGKRGGVLQKWHQPGGVATSAQLAVRERFFQAKESWNALTFEEQEEYNDRARDLRITGYNLYIREFEPDMLKVKKIILTNEQIKNLAGTPIDLLPIPSLENILYVPVSCFISANIVNTYSNLEMPSALLIQYNNEVDFFEAVRNDSDADYYHLNNLLISDPSINNCVLQAGQSQAGFSFPSKNGPVSSVPIQGISSAGQKVVIWISNGSSGPLEDGDEENTLTIVISYFEIAL